MAFPFKPGALYRDYETVSALVEAEFDRNARRFADHPAPAGGRGLQCRRGCTACCSQLFDISLVESAYLSRHVRSLPAEKQAELRRRADAYRPQRQKLLTGRARERWAQQVEGRLPLEGLRLPCPALDPDGSCAVYQARPLVCRKFGMPLYHPNRPGQLGACELNFASGDELEPGEIVENQTRIHHRWENLKQVVRESHPQGARLFTVADALVEDCDAALQQEEAVSSGRSK